MEVNKWFENGCNYQKGVVIYSKIKGHRNNLYRLFLRKESNLNLEKLKYELKKYRIKPKIKKASTISTTPKNFKAFKIAPKTENSQKNYFYRLNELHSDLHQLSIKQRNDFQTAISLHSKLTGLHFEEEGLALTFSLEIENLFDSIETIQKILDHYVKHKIVLNIEKRNFNDLSPGQLVVSRLNKRSMIVRYSKKLVFIKDKLKESLCKSEENKMQVLFQKTEEKLLNLSLQINQLNFLINKK